MSEVIVVTSGKGGVGKTTTAANIGTGLAALDKKVVLVDTDIGLEIWMWYWDSKTELCISGRCHRRKLPIKTGADQG